MQVARRWFVGWAGAAGLGSSHVIPGDPQERAAMGVPEFTVDVFQNAYLPIGECEVNAVVTVTSTCSTADVTAAAAEIIIVDCSGSMGTPQSKIAAYVIGTDEELMIARHTISFLSQRAGAAAG